MKRIYIFAVALLLTVLLMGCNSNTQSGIEGYEDTDIAAIVRGTEITIGDLRFMHADEDVLEMIESAAQVELIKQEVIRLGLGQDIPDKMAKHTEYLKNHTMDDFDMEEADRKLIKSQAKKLRMDIQEYFRKHTAILSEQSYYLSAYAEGTFRDFEYMREVGIEQYNEEYEEFFEKVMKENESDIEIRIKKS